jgi:sterol desaturase/sphingolipid hydroxylase (fatty acid hydroxylase superfamily)
VDTLLALWRALENFLATELIAPFLGWLHLAALTDSPDEIARFLIISAIQVGVIGLVFRPLESLAPVEVWPDRKATRIDRSYTVLKLLGLVPLFTYLILVPVSNLLGGDGDSDGVLQIDRLVPWFKQHPVLLFLVYFTVYDFTLYVVHRLQHAVPAWWMLHSLHHSQRQLSCWSNDRDSFLDDVFEAVIISVVSILIGASPTEYAVLVLIGQLIENFSHANVRFGFGKVLDKILVDPRFHRLHHRLDNPDDAHRNCNFALVFPLWDIVFGTACYDDPPQPCGVVATHIDADNERGLWAQQWAAMARFWSVLWQGKSSILRRPDEV